MSTFPFPFSCVLLTPEEMNLADQATNKLVGNDFLLMENAGRAVAQVVEEYYRSFQHVAVICGAGNNGGDGFIAAEELRRLGREVFCVSGTTAMKTHEAQMARDRFQGKIVGVSEFSSDFDGLVVDALFGSGLDRPISGDEAKLVDVINHSGSPIVAVDLPSGISGATGNILGAAVIAQTTVTFFRRKIGHLLYPGRHYSGKIIVKDIGIAENVLTAINPKNFVNQPKLWANSLPRLEPATYKYKRGHAAVFSGPRFSTGASRLSAQAAARVGAGAVTLLGDQAALNEQASHVTSIMLYKCNTFDEGLAYFKKRNIGCCVIGPGFGKSLTTRAAVSGLLRTDKLPSVVLDADALTSFSDDPEHLFQLIKQSKLDVILTPHEGEFSALFHDLGGAPLSRVQKARIAAERSHAFIVYKGPDTVIVAPTGELAINENGTPLLATAGSGDVLAGIITGLCAQKMPTFHACCAGVWIHAAAAQSYATNLIAEDLVRALPQTLAQLTSV